MSKRVMMALIPIIALIGWIGTRDVSHGQVGKTPRHRIVFEVNVAGDEAWTSILNNVENLQKAFGADSTSIEVVAHGKGLGLLLAKDDALKERLARIRQSGVVLDACENTMRRQNVTKADLLPFVSTVPSGVAEVILRQEAGWSYLKGGF